MYLESKLRKKKKALDQLTKSDDVDEPMRKLRVGTILFYLCCTSAPSFVQQNWNSLPLELVMYLIQNTVGVESNDSRCTKWNMFGLPIGWQIIDYLDPISIGKLGVRHSIMYDGDCANKTLSYISIVRLEHLICEIIMHRVDGGEIQMRFKDDNYYGHIIHGKYIDPTNSLKIYEYKKTIYGTSRGCTKFCWMNLVFYNVFPKLNEDFAQGENYSIEDALNHIVEFQKYFETFQQLLLGNKVNRTFLF
jgi:hypothetical protein